MRELYLDCSMGAAGDMLAGALLELFPDSAAILAELNGLGIPGVVFSAEKISSHGIGCTHFKVSFNGQEEHRGEGGRHEHSHHEHSHHHHSLADIFSVVDTLPLRPQTGAKIKEVYEKIARAEAEVHGREMTNIHFHELGTMDALADITAVCLMMEKLSPERVTCVHRLRNGVLRPRASAGAGSRHGAAAAGRSRFSRGDPVRDVHPYGSGAPHLLCRRLRHDARHDHPGRGLRRRQQGV